jgi:hypothetical protein
MIYHDGGVYKGQWKDGEKEGFGEETYQDLGRYKGQYKKGMREGLGKL